MRDGGLEVAWIGPPVADVRNEPMAPLTDPERERLAFLEREAAYAEEMP